MYRSQRLSTMGLNNVLFQSSLHQHRNILHMRTSRISNRQFGFYAKYKEAKRTFQPPTEERNLRSFITWKTNLSAFTILVFSCGVYWYTIKHVCFIIIIIDQDLKYISYIVHVRRRGKIEKNECVMNHIDIVIHYILPLLLLFILAKLYQIDSLFKVQMCMNECNNLSNLNKNTCHASINFNNFSICKWKFTFLAFMLLSTNSFRSNNLWLSLFIDDDKSKYLC